MAKTIKICFTLPVKLKTPILTKVDYETPTPQ